MKKINKKGYLYFHQGWTDIVNQLSLISYYSHRYENICCIMRKDAKPLVDFYVSSLDNVENELDNAFTNVDEVCDNMQLKLTRLWIRYDKDNYNLFNM